MSDHTYRKEHSYHLTNHVDVNTEKVLINDIR
jgi:hypothetical protein